MKIFTKSLKALLLFAALVGTQAGLAQINQCSVSISYTQNANGNVAFSAVTTQSVGSNTWNFGNGVLTYTTGANPVSTTYTANGVYTVTLALVNTAFTCTSVVTQTISVTNVTVCATNAAFSSSSTTPGTYNFVSTSTGTSATSSYAWNYGDGSTGTGSSSSHAYSADGTYAVTLIASDATPATCTDSAIGYVTVCTATNNFVFTNNPNGVVSFSSTAPTNTTSYFSWTFGDGTSLSGMAGTAAAPNHSYATNGSYVVTMNYSSAFGCTVSTQYTVTVSNITNPCNLNVGFTSYVGANNVVYFTNTTTGTSGGVTYLWNFGDGNTSTSTSPTHTYASTGNFWVTLYANNNFTYTCVDSTVASVSIPTCVANAGFSVTPSGTPLYWNATVFSPTTIAAATWSWGDGTTSNTLFTSHTYSTAGVYTICLTVTTTCGAVGTSCSLYNIYRPAGGADALDMVHINVIDQSAVGIKNNSAESIAFSIVPNPSAGAFRLNVAGLNSDIATIRVFNLVGQEVYTTEAGSTGGVIAKDIQLDVTSGVYFLKVSANQQTVTKRLVISGK